MTNTTDRDHASAPATNGAPCARSFCPTAETKTLAELAAFPSPSLCSSGSANLECKLECHPVRGVPRSRLPPGRLDEHRAPAP
jgi:hypothetical protein